MFVSLAGQKCQDNGPQEPGLNTLKQRLWIKIILFYHQLLEIKEALTCDSDHVDPWLLSLRTNRKKSQLPCDEILLIRY